MKIHTQFFLFMLLLISICLILGYFIDEKLYELGVFPFVGMLMTLEDFINE